MNLLYQCETAINAANQDLNVVVPLGIFWDCQCNLLVNYTENPRKRAELVYAYGISLQIIKLNHSGQVSRYWGIKRLSSTTVDSLNAEVVNLLTEHLGMRKIRYDYLKNSFCGGNRDELDELEHAVIRPQFIKEIPTDYVDDFIDNVE